jgi:hypothetical protein
MGGDSARKWMILSSLAITGLQMLFLTVAPAFGFPLVYPQNLGLLEIISPVFLGYLGSATNFVFANPRSVVRVQTQFLGYLAVGPILIYALVVIAAFAAFGYSNRVGAPIGSGMSRDDLATALSAALGLLAVTTGVIISNLFVASEP